MSFFGSPYYGSSYYTGPSADKPINLDYYRTDQDGFYTFHWSFDPSFISPSLMGFDYQLELDTDPGFGNPLVFQTVTEAAAVVTSGYSLSAPFASINISNKTLSLNIDGDGVQTITIVGPYVTGAAIAANIQTLVRGLTANHPVNQPAYNNFTATFSGASNQYKLTSGSSGIGSTVVVTGGTAAPILLLGKAQGGFEVRGNSDVMQQTARSVLIVHNSSGIVFSDVSATTNTPGPQQYVVSIPNNQVTFNSADLPDTLTVIYVPTTSGQITQFQRGNVVKGYTVPVYPRIDSAVVTFYARVRIIEAGAGFSPFSDTLTVETIPNVVLESSNRLLQDLPDFHVYPVDESYKPLNSRTTNIAKIYQAYATEEDRWYLEKENAIRDVEQNRTRDPRLYDIIGSRFSYPQPLNMEAVDYRLIVSSLKEAALDGGTYHAVKLVGSAFTGVDPTITTISQDFNFITADETLSIEEITVPSSPAYTALLSAAIRKDPIIPGSLISGPVTTTTQSLTISSSPPYTVTLTNPPADIPVISGYTFTNGAPAAGQFAVNYVTGVLTFNAANAGASISVTYTPHYNLSGKTITINIDGDGAQTITLVGPFASKVEIAAAIQSGVRSLTAGTPSNQPSYSNFITIYNGALDQFVLVSGNQSPTTASSVVVSGGTGASLLELLLANGAIQTTGLAYKTPTQYSGAAGTFRNNIDSGNGSLLTFPSSEANAHHTVVYKKKSTIYTYLSGSTTQSLTIPASPPYTLTLTNPPANIPSIPGFVFTTNATPAVGQFTVDFPTGVLTFNAANAGTGISVTYVSNVPQPPTLYSRTEAGFGIKIVLNNPGDFTLDKPTIAFLLRQILPANTKFILV